MPGRAGKITARKNLPRQLSPEIPSPIKLIEPNPFANDDDIENRMPMDQSESKDDSSSIAPRDDEQTTPVNSDDFNPLAILLATGQPLLTNFEEKYLLDLMIKSNSSDMEKILREKIPSILQMNYPRQSSGFVLNPSWIYDFLLKHFQILIGHEHGSEAFSKFLAKKFDQTNSNLTFKHWQLQTLINEHVKQKSSTTTNKRRMTVRHIDLK